MILSQYDDVVPSTYYVWRWTWRSVGVSSLYDDDHHHHHDGRETTTAIHGRVLLRLSVGRG